MDWRFCTSMYTTSGLLPVYLTVDHRSYTLSHVLRNSSSYTGEMNVWNEVFYIYPRLPARKFCCAILISHRTAGTYHQQCQFLSMTFQQQSGTFPGLLSDFKELWYIDTAEPNVLIIACCLLLKQSLGLPEKISSWKYYWKTIHRQLFIEIWNALKSQHVSLL